MSHNKTALDVAGASDFPTRKPRVVLFSEHVYQSKRRAGFHWLADAYAAAGWDVVFVTVAISRLSRLKGDYRLSLFSLQHHNRLRRVGPSHWSYVWYTPFHPMNLHNSIANALSASVFRRYGNLRFDFVENIIRDATTIVVESSPGLALVPRLKLLAPEAFFVYRVSDDVSTIGAHPIVKSFEGEALASFNLVSVPSDSLAARLFGKAPVAIQYHGLEKSMFDTHTSNPYSAGRHAISVGATLFDRAAIEGLAAASPSVTFHIFGNVGRLASLPNIVTYGERPFADLIPYLQHADIGVAAYSYRDGCEYLAQTSNKLMQYTYCRLPILLPEHIPCKGKHIFTYRADDPVSLARAVSEALSFDHAAVDRGEIRSWEEVRVAIETRRSS